MARRLVAALFPVAIAAAQETQGGGGTDATVAAAARWPGPRGTASGNVASRALPVVSEVEEAWRLEFDAVETPPVHWDGTGYVVVRAGEKPFLVAFDLSKGRELARSPLRAFDARAGLSVWDHMVYLQPDEKQVSGYRLAGRTLDLAFVLRGQTIDGTLCYPRMPAVHDNEIYVLLGRYLARFRAGSLIPRWTSRIDVPWGWHIHPARPCVHGGEVILACFVEPDREREPKGALKIPGRPNAGLVVAAFRRSDGRSLPVTVGGARDRELPGLLANGYTTEDGPAIEAVIAGSCLYVRSPWLRRPLDFKAIDGVFAPFDVERGIAFAAPRGWTSATLPSYHPSRGAILLAGSGPEVFGLPSLEWVMHRGDKVFSFAAASRQPDLFEDRVAPTVLGDIVYFGSWAADMETGEILWRLPVRQVTFPAVPADRLVLVVEGGRVLRAFRGRGGRR